MKRASVFFLAVLQLTGCLCVSLNAISREDNADLLPSSSRSLVESCEGIFNPTCLKLKFISFIDGLSQSDYTIYPGINVVKDGNEDKSKAMVELEDISRSFPDEPEKRVDSYLMYKIGSFFETHSLKLKLAGDQSARGLLDGYDEVDDDEDDEITEEDDSRKIFKKKGGKFGAIKKKKKIIGVILAIGAIMKGVVGAISTGAIFLIAGKALITSILALIISGIVGLKALVSKEEGAGAGGATAVKPHYHQDDSYYPYARSIEIKLPEHLSKPE